MQNNIFKDATFNIEVADKTLNVSRTIKFNDGNEISILVILQRSENVSLADLHIKSIQAAIENLKTLILKQ